MNGLLWLLRRSFRNWLVLKIKRLRQPKYAISAIFLALYLCMILAPWGLASSGAAGDRAQSRGVLEALVTGFVSLSFTWSWIFGAQGALAFTMPEAVLLFPAPVSRRQLLATKIIRSQLPVLISALFFTYASRSAAPHGKWQVLATNLLLLNGIFLNRLVAALAQCPRPATGKPHWVAHAGKAAAVLVLAAIAVSFRPVAVEPTFASILSALASWGDREPARWVLAPFRAFAGPALAASRAELVQAAVAPASIVLGLLAIVLLWDVPFEETALGVSETLKQRIDQIRRTGRLRQPKGRPNAAPIPLPSRAGPILALAWKNYLGITRMPLKRALLYALLAVLASMLVPLFEKTEWLALPLFAISLWSAVMATFLGPDTLRSDLRVSLRGADFLKTLPVRGWKIFLGEILAGPVVLIAFQALLIGLAAIVGHGQLEGIEPPTIAWLWLSTLILLFPIDILVFTIANGAAVLFPSWVQLGQQKERGAEAIGQNFLVGIVRYLVLFAGLLPAGGVAAALAGLGAWIGLGPHFLPLAALGGASIIAIEIAILVSWLGGALERLDPSLELG